MQAFTREEIGHAFYTESGFRSMTSDRRADFLQQLIQNKSEVRRILTDMTQSPNSVLPMTEQQVLDKIKGLVVLDFLISDAAELSEGRKEAM